MENIALFCCSLALTSLDACELALLGQFSGTWFGPISTMAAPSHRVRGKSAPRGKSPDPKALKKALKVQQKSKSGLVTPSKSSSHSSRSSTPVAPKKLTFGEVKVHQIKAENKPGKGFEDETMKGEKADAIIAAMRKEPCC